MYATPLNSAFGIFGYLVSPSGLERIVRQVGPDLEQYITSPSVAKVDMAVITAIHALHVLAALRVKSGQISPPRTHLHNTGPLWFRPRDGYAVVSSDPRYLEGYKEYPATVQAALRETIASHCHSRVEARLRRGQAPAVAEIQKIERAFRTGLWQ